jgi:predicted O-methyltransferase YrrM
VSYDSLSVGRALGDYLISVSLREPDILAALREETAHHAYSGMQIAAEQGQLMALLVKLMGAKRCIEIGTFTGYSSLAVALALPEDGVAGKIELRLAPALETLGRLLKAGAAGSFDFAFIDAEKTEYDEYYEACLELLRPRGLMVIDNVLWGGQVADPNRRDQSTMAFKRLNKKIHADQRVDISMLPFGDGVTLALKR